jgi:hypothetical protein
MKATVLLFLVWNMAACAGRPSPSASSPDSRATGVTASQPSDDPARALSLSECTSLGQSLAEACDGRPNERSARIDGWCSDIVHGVADNTWASHDCVKNIKYMDATCFRGATNVHSMMACDDGVQRP